MTVFPEVCDLPGVEGGYYDIKANLRWPPLSLTKPLRIPRLELCENENQAARRVWPGDGPCPHATIIPRRQVASAPDAILSSFQNFSTSSGFLLNIISIKALKDSTPKKVC